MLEKPLI